MLTYPEIDPVALAIGPLKVHWYGLMYLVGFVGGWMLGRVQAARPWCHWSAREVDDLVFYIVLGIVAGGRLGYMVFYGLDQWLAEPLLLLQVWRGGMSFHGGLIGVLIAMWLYARRHGRRFFVVTDFIAPLVTVGLGAGRIGNFINGELWGKPTDLPWGMQLPCVRFPAFCQDLPYGVAWSLPVHPTQLYEALLEGLALFLILWLYARRPRPTMAVSGLFLLCYATFRIGVELLRLPDAHIGYLAFGWLTMGQLLSLPMLVAGAFLMLAAYRSDRGAQAA